MIKYRFNQQEIEKLLMIDFKRINEDFIKSNIDLFYHNIISDDLLNNFPKKIEVAYRPWRAIDENKEIHF